MIHYLSHVTRSVGLNAGEVLEVHAAAGEVACQCGSCGITALEVAGFDGAVIQQGVVTLDSFRRWDYDREFTTADPTGKYVGIVHDDGACLVRV